MLGNISALVFKNPAQRTIHTGRSADVIVPMWRGHTDLVRQVFRDVLAAIRREEFVGKDEAANTNLQRDCFAVASVPV